jgi:hypothetical protein
MRALFNEWGYWQRVKEGEFVELLFSTHAPGPAAPPSLQDGTESQEVHYFDRQVRRRAIVHQYLQPDGTLGASGKPDPKYLMGDDGTIYALAKKQ